LNGQPARAQRISSPASTIEDRGSRIEVTRNGRKIDIAPHPDSLGAPLFELIDYMHDKGDLPCALPELPPAVRASTLTTTSDTTGRRASIEFTHPRTRGQSHGTPEHP
jgi:hypothetical protein